MRALKRHRGVRSPYTSPPRDRRTQPSVIDTIPTALSLVNPMKGVSSCCDIWVRRRTVFPAESGPGNKDLYLSMTNVASAAANRPVYQKEVQ